MQGCVPKSSKQQFSLQGVWCSDDVHLCIDGGDILIRIATPIKLCQKGRFEPFRDMCLPHFILKWTGIQCLHFHWRISLMLALLDVVDIVFQSL